MSKREKTKYPGVFYRESKRTGGSGFEKVFYIVFKKDGKFYEEKAGRQFSDDMTPARAAYIRAQRIEGRLMSRKEKKAQKEALKQLEKNKWTVDRLWQKYKKEKPGLKGWHTYESCYKLHIFPNFGMKEPKNILKMDIKRVENKLNKIRSPQTVQHVLELLRRIINFGAEEGLCAKLPFIIKMPTVKNIKTEYLTKAEIARLSQAIDEDPHPQAGTMMRLVLFSGLRRGELFRLKWEHINFKKEFISLVDTKSNEDKKIPLSEPAKKLLIKYKEKNLINNNGSPYVFPGRNGGQRTNISRQVNRIKEAAGLPKDFRPLHGLRHTFASTLANSDKVNMYVLQKLLTHSDFKMTERYAHLRDETLKKAANLAGELLKNDAAQPENDVVRFKSVGKR